MNFYYREFDHQNWETHRSQGADHKNIDCETNRLLVSTHRLIEISIICTRDNKIPGYHLPRNKPRPATTQGVTQPITAFVYQEVITCKGIPRIHGFSTNCEGDLKLNNF